MRIWIFQTGEPLHSDVGALRPMRAMNLANILLDRGHEVVLWSSSFFHQEKRHRTEGYKVIRPRKGLEIRLLPSPGYKKNVGLSRLYDHAKLAKNLLIALKKNDFSCPDVAFVGYPPIETADVLARWLEKRGIPFIVDVKDQWPSIFLDKFPPILRPFLKLAFFPYFYLGKRSLRKANALSSVSRPFLEWSQNFAMRAVSAADIVVPLTTEKHEFVGGDFETSKRLLKLKGIDLQDDQPRFCFAGSFSTAFDFSAIIAVASRFKKEHIASQFVLCGNGREMDSVREMALGLDNVIFLGWVSADEINALFSVATASFAPYRNSDDFKQSIPNKIIDAMANSLPVLTSLEGEVKSIIQETKAGLFYKDSETLYSHCTFLLSDKKALRRMKRQAEICYDERFDFQTVYGRLASVLEKLGSNDERQAN